MPSLVEIEAELETLRAYARRFTSFDGQLLCDGRPPTDAEAAKLKTGLARAEGLMAAAERLRTH